MREEDSAVARVLNQAVERASKVNLEARMSSLMQPMYGGAPPTPQQAITAENFGNDNTSGGLASFLQENLLLSDLNQQKQGGGSRPNDGAVNSQQSVGDFLKKSGVSLSPAKPFNASIHNQR